MGSRRSKEDDVNRISISIYVTNFPENFSAKELFQSLVKQYGHVLLRLCHRKRRKKLLEQGSRAIIMKVANSPRPNSGDSGSSNSYVNAVSYLGELWVLLEFFLCEIEEAFRDNVGVSSCLGNSPCFSPISILVVALCGRMKVFH
ncbi:hypothetical protein Tco_0804430 [Tanacetum coccineum]|uniref:Uncharacterized protein n=1 Tax=Tanacetum coccineum TaxID=301880 RepID=A0ABQ5A861_9ASTR